MLRCEWSGLRVGVFGQGLRGLSTVQRGSLHRPHDDGREKSAGSKTQNPNRESEGFGCEMQGVVCKRV